MKALIALALILSSASVFAMPAVGDSATYQINTQGMTITQKIELTAYDAGTNSFIQVETTTVQGQQQKATTRVAADEFMSDESADLMMTYCESQLGGTLQTITVVAGTFSTCSIYDPASAGQVYMGKVPFGLIKVQGSDVAAQLIDYKNGK